MPKSQYFRYRFGVLFTKALNKGFENNSSSYFIVCFLTVGCVDLHHFRLFSFCSTLLLCSGLFALYWLILMALTLFLLTCFNSFVLFFNGCALMLLF